MVFRQVHFPRRNDVTMSKEPLWGQLMLLMRTSGLFYQLIHLKELINHTLSGVMINTSQSMIE